MILRYSDFLSLLSFLSSQIPIGFCFCVFVEALLNSVNFDISLSESNRQKLRFISEQLSFIDNPPGVHHPYSPSLLTTAILWKAQSTAFCKAILKDSVLTLPSIRTISRVTAKFSSIQSDAEKYLKQRIMKLSSTEKACMLIFDEVYVYQTLDYDNGKFVGLSANDNSPASSVLCFIVKSFSSSYSDIVKMVPLNANTLHEKYQSGSCKHDHSLVWRRILVRFLGSVSAPFSSQKVLM